MMRDHQLRMFGETLYPNSIPRQRRDRKLLVSEQKGLQQAGESEQKQRQKPDESVLGINGDAHGYDARRGPNQIP